LTNPSQRHEQNRKAKKQKMLAGERYNAGDSEIQLDLAAASEWLVRYNATLALGDNERHRLSV